MKQTRDFPLKKRAYATPEVALLKTMKYSNLLNSFSGDIEGWEDDEIIPIQG